MKKLLNCSYSIIDREFICEHKRGRVTPSEIKTVHNHDGYEVVLFLEGDVTIVVEPDIFKMQRGDIFFISPLVYHGLDLVDIGGYERIVVNVQYDYLKALGDKDTDFSTLFTSAPSSNMNHLHIPEKDLPKFIALADKLESLMTSNSFGHSVLQKAYLAEFLLLASEYSTATPNTGSRSIIPPLVSKIFDYVEEHISDEITINNMAADLHYSSDHLSRAFREATGGSLKNYVNGKKIVLAQKYLLQNYSPYDVCFMVGFGNYSSFSRRFSDQIGTSPKQFQIMHRA